MGGCASRPEGKETAIEVLFARSMVTEEAKLMERQALEIEAFKHTYTEQTIRTAMARVEEAREAYHEQLAQSTHQRFVGHSSSASRAPVIRCERDVAMAETSLEKAKQEMHKKIAEMRTRHRLELEQQCTPMCMTSPSPAVAREALPIVSQHHASPPPRPNTSLPLQDVSDSEDEDERWAETERRRLQQEEEGRRILREERQQQARELQQVRARRAHERILERAEQNRQQQAKRQERQQQAQRQQPAAWQQQQLERRSSSGNVSGGRRASASRH